jgi:ribosomal RNA-processing protein 17
MPPASKKRKIGSTAPAEITFDFAAREEYLTGFHKRKQARIKHAQEEAVKKDNEERLRLRREVCSIQPVSGPYSGRAGRS